MHLHVPGFILYHPFTISLYTGKTLEHLVYSALGRAMVPCSSTFGSTYTSVCGLRGDFRPRDTYLEPKTKLIHRIPKAKLETKPLATFYLNCLHRHVDSACRPVTRLLLGPISYWVQLVHSLVSGTAFIHG